MNIFIITYNKHINKYIYIYIYIYITTCCDGNNENTHQEGWEGEHDIVVPILSPLCDVNIDE